MVHAQVVKHYRTSRTPQERFWEKVEKTETCWIWTGAIHVHRHGVFNAGRDAPKGKKSPTMWAHRYAYMVIVGDLPEGLVLDHLCKNPVCVNPDHLEPVTQSENAKRGGIMKGYCRKGHLLTDENSYHRKTGSRECRICRDAAIARWREANAEKIKIDRRRRWEMYGT